MKYVYISHDQSLQAYPLASQSFEARPTVAGSAQVRNLKSRHGFSLIELLIVITIIALLISLLLPALSSARRLAIQVQCGSVMRQAGIGFGAYRNDYREWVVRIQPKTGATATSGVRWHLNDLATYHESLESYWPAPARYCPSVAKPDNNRFEWAYSAPLLDNLYAAEGYMGGRATAPGSLSTIGYVKIVPGPAILTPSAGGASSTWGTLYRHTTSGRGFDPIYAMPLLSDLIQTSNHSTPYRIAPHNGGPALSRSDKTMNPDGGHSLWEDLSVQWYNWPLSARQFAQPELNYATTLITQYPRDISAGTRPEGWSSSGNEYTRYHFWVKKAQRQ